MERLTKLKTSRMKELVIQRRSELEEIVKMTHIEPDKSTAAEKSITLIDCGTDSPWSVCHSNFLSKGIIEF